MLLYYKYKKLIEGGRYVHTEMATDFFWDFGKNHPGESRCHRLDAGSIGLTPMGCRRQSRHSSRCSRALVRSEASRRFDRLLRSNRVQSHLVTPQPPTESRLASVGRFSFGTRSICGTNAYLSLFMLREIVKVSQWTIFVLVG
ncbi:MAG: hypothetical protein UW78_C0006G0119 [Candidatus Azambacteria bacterium GW2011_GWA1_44_9]|uniref:Uncharacterized protein n=1 Tax=Candidatus Azambacteria bacterium GW2011_GWA1_44_9 TaxID=1618610 RepID=A0A0G1NC38_9BACT|nr:MAG: hypothetical protein UW78_C0006G0119 [Candidatus Azambacteria bacterium GW2011_GWA1_44_9]